MNPFAADDINLRIHAFDLSHDRNNPDSGIIQQYSADILGYVSELGDEDAGSSLELNEDGYAILGKLRFGIVDVGQACNEHESIYEACDALSQDYYELHHELFTQQNALRQRVINLVDWPLEPGIIYIESLYLDPRYRGSQLGLAAVNTVLKRFGRGCSLAVLIAAPFRTDTQHKDPSPAAQAKAHKRLRHYYQQLGFKRLGTGNYMVRNLDYLVSGW